ncbi:unnamed protein product [Adineta steineri]|uniref:Uncharacterized protein n=1 Tax=Adineta steineri TaxID=433720 RepID=A0A816FB97_9BILA|nr:unnamed protein product [Adineta steineri]CAF1657996.1 unnamed protein product [Adineta steineri]
MTADDGSTLTLELCHIQSYPNGRNDSGDNSSGIIVEPIPTTTTTTSTTTTTTTTTTSIAVLTFGDIPSASPDQGNITSPYYGLNWSNFYYINASAYTTSAYHYIQGTGQYVAWFKQTATIQPSGGGTIGINSFIAVAPWTPALTLGITGYYLNSQVNSTTVPLTNTGSTTVTLNWLGLDTIQFTTTGGTPPDIGINNLSITF